MRRTALLLLLAAGRPASAHRLDEYLQLTAISLERGRIRATMYLTPGVAVAKRVIALIELDGDGAVSAGEGRIYARRTLGDMLLTLDGRRLRPRLVGFRFPKVEEMRRGVGEIRIDLDAPMTLSEGNHRLVFENRHQRSIAAYLVECFVPDDPGLRVTSQSRSVEQSRYEVRFART